MGGWVQPPPTASVVVEVAKQGQPRCWWFTACAHTSPDKAAAARLAFIKPVA